mmetsp:Transcript_40785/g.96132  ORF Transcript_40785/g.96132 Transcript_40785/m.96132 type:complete len:871 (-) Transcript_40785:64-2676(-)
MAVERMAVRRGGSAGRWGLVVGVLAFFYAEGAAEITTSRPFLIDSQVADMQWVNNTKAGAKPNAKTVFVRSMRGSIYRSTDDGMNWVSQRDKMTDDDGSEPFQTRVSVMLFSQADAKYAVMKGYGENNWFTKDQGDTYAKHSFGVMSEIKMHPTRPEVLLASKYEGSFPNRYMSLFISEDLGASWKKIVKNVFQFEWGDPAVKGFSDKTILACVRKADTTPKNAFSDWDPNIDFVVSHDYFKTSDIKVLHGNRFAFHDPYYFVAAMNPLEELEVILHVSPDKGATFQRAQFPYQLSERSYRVVDSKEDSVFVQVAHGSRDTSFANVYMSGPSGREYTLSLRGVVKDYRGLTDFERINGVDGVYVANVADQAAEPEMSLLGGLQAVIFSNHLEDGMIPTRSLISFDKGALWKPIKAPTHDHKGNSIDVCEGCSLHLNGKTSGMLGPVYSSVSSTGLIIATGNVGHHLHERADETNTYFSRDAGQTWEQIKKGSYIYEYGDHGALMVLADNRQATRKLMYSWNEGLNWTDFTFWDHDIEVENIITEPSGNSQIFVIYGRRGDKGVVMQINFETLHERRCEGINAAGGEGSDYEFWTPADSIRKGSCLMGRKVTYTRRKRAVQCFNGWDFDRKEARASCECTRADFECDFGYQLAGEGEDKQTCLRVPDMPVAGFGAPEDCAAYFTVSRGYRRVPGDTCVGGDVSGKLDPLVQSCPGFGWTSMVMLTAVVSLGAVLAWVTYARRKDQGLAAPWSSKADLLDFFHSGARGFGPLGSSFSHTRYTGLADGPDMDDDDLGLGDDDDEAQVLGESLHEYALGVTPSPSSSFHPPPIIHDLLDLEANPSGTLPPLPASAPPRPSAPLPSLDPPPPGRK